MDLEIIQQNEVKKPENSWRPRGPTARRPLPRMQSSGYKKPVDAAREHRESSRPPSSLDERDSTDSEFEQSREDLRCSSARESSPLPPASSQLGRRRKKSSRDYEDSNAPAKTKIPDKTRESGGRYSGIPAVSRRYWPVNRWCICCILPAVCLLILYITLESDAHNVTIDGEARSEKEIQRTLNDLGRNIDGLKETFKRQDPSIWGDIEAGIAEVIRRPQRPTTFLFFANQDHPMFCLAKMIGNAGKIALKSENNLFLSPENMGNDYGMVIHKYREPIKQQKVVIVENLLDIHPEAMKAFHNFCDRENPAVAEAIYLLTMTTDSYKNESYVEFIEDQLTRKLRGKIDDDKLQPLITRLTDAAIIHVQPESSVKRCPLRY